VTVPDESAGPTRVSLVVIDGAPEADVVVEPLVKDAFLIDRLPSSELGRGGGPTGLVALVWLPAGAPADLLQRAVRWRAQGNRPAALLGCAPDGTTEDSERALGAGFDDFVAGRGGAREISARLRALVRRLRTPAQRALQPMRFGRIVLDRASSALFLDGRRVSLTRLERRVVEALVLGSGRTLARAELAERAWGDLRRVGPRAIDNLVQRLRRKLRDEAIVVTVRGVGFRLSAD